MVIILLSEDANAYNYSPLSFYATHHWGEQAHVEKVWTCLEDGISLHMASWVSGESTQLFMQ